MIQTNLSYINITMDEMKKRLDEKVQKNDIHHVNINRTEQYILFLSIGNPKIRAKVIQVMHENYQRAFDSLRQKLVKMVRKNHINPEWIKLDIVVSLEETPFEQLEKNISNTRKNYFRNGIAFDENFKIAFLEQEINGNALIRNKRGELPRLNDKNINHYLNYKTETNIPFMVQRYRNKQVYVFNTVSIFKDRKEKYIVKLYNGNRTNGIRKVNDIKEETKKLIEKSTYFLMNQVTESGKFEYGYFSAFAKSINTYNILRHSSSLYSMCEGFEIVKDKKVIKSVEKGINYLINEAIVYKDSVERVAYVVDYANEKEIKLGSNATAILAITKYTEVTGDNKYLGVAKDLARGIIQMKLPDEGFIHVLSYPTYSIKDLNRIIYYEGEAIFALLRLYAIDKDHFWLDEVIKTFDYFIENEYWKYHDHWLSYAANELTDYIPEEKYFIFGLKNCNDRLNFIYHRETTYPTFLELTMAAYKMVQKIKGSKKKHLLTYINEEFLIKTIDHRAEYQRVGFFYPEIAMFKKLPGLILNGFFIRHHSFRVRIDDVEHYLSGYCQYYHHRLNRDAKID